MADAIAPESGPLSIDQATAALTPKEEKQAPEPSAPSKPDDSSTAPTAEEQTAEPETAIDGDDAEQEEPEAEEPAQPAIEPPRFWDAEAKRRFGELPRDVQEVIARHEDMRNTATTKALQETADKRKAAEGEASKLTQYVAALDQLIPQAVNTFQSRWVGSDKPGYWDQIVDTYGADQALKLRNQFETELGQIQQMTTAQNEVQQVQFRKFVETEEAKLPAVAPDLADVKLGRQRREEVGKFLIERGFPIDRINAVSAEELSIAYDAMRFRQANKNAATLAQQPKPAAQSQRPAVRTTATPGSRTSQSARLQQLSRKKELSSEEAVELLLARET